MTTKELVEDLSKRTDMPATKIIKVLKEFENVVCDSLGRGKKVMVSGFGTFDLSKRKAREGVSPQTGARIKIAAMTLPHFRPGERLKKAVK